MILPYLNPYQLVKLAANMATCLSRYGVVALDEADRAYSLFYRVGYKDVIVRKAGEDRLVVSYHAGYLRAI